MRPALTLSTRRAKSSTCLFKQCYFELEKRSFLTSTQQVKPQLPALWFLVTRPSSSQALLKEEKKHHENLYKKFHPRSMNKDTDLQHLIQFLATDHVLTPKEVYKSLRTALYNTSQYDDQKAWLIYETMVYHQVDKYLKPNQYGLLLCILKYGENVNRMLTVLNSIKAHPEHQLNHYHISQVLFAMSRQGLAKEACELLRSMSLSNADLYPTVNHYHSLAVALKNHHNSKDPVILERVTQLMLEAMQKRHLILDNTTLSTMVSLLAPQKDLTLQFLRAMDHVNSSTRSKHPYNVYIYTSLIAGFARQKDSESAKKIYAEMRKQKITPNQVTLAALMEAYSSAGDFTAAIQLLTNHYKRHRKVSNAMVTSLLVNAIRLDNLPVAAKTAQFIRNKKMEKDDILRAALLWLETKEDMDHARRSFDALYKEESVTPFMVNHLVKGYGSKQDIRNVVDMYKVHRQLDGDTMRNKHYLADALFHCRDVPAAMTVFISMRQYGVPDDVTLAMVIKGLVVNNEGNLAWRLFRTLQGQGIEPNVRAYSTILKTLGHRDRDLKKKHSESGLDAKTISAAGIIDSYDYLNSTIPATTEALTLFRRMTGFQQPNVYTYTTLISCFAKHNLTRAISIFDDMCHQHIQPSVETYTALLQGCAIFRDSQAALTVFNHMSEKQVTPNAITWRYLLKSLLRARVDKAKVQQVAHMARQSLDKSSLEKN